MTTNASKISLLAPNVNASGTLDTYGNLYPATSNTAEIGSSSYKWKHVYIGSNLYLPASTSDPTGTEAGQCYFNTSTNEIRIYDGSVWGRQKVLRYQPYALDFFKDGSGISLLRFDSSIGDDGGASTFSSGSFTYSTGSTGSTGTCIDYGSSNGGSYVGIEGRGPRSAVSGGFTWSFWMYYYGSTFNDHGFFGTNSSSSEGHLFHFHAGSNQFYLIQSGGSSISNKTVSNPQSWNHFCTTFGENNQMKLYLNGTLQGAVTCTNNFPSTYSTQTLFVGRDRCCEDSMRYTNGAFDHVRIFNRPLNSTEVQALYQEFTL